MAEPLGLKALYLEQHFSVFVEVVIPGHHLFTGRPLLLGKQVPQLQPQGADNLLRWATSMTGEKNLAAIPDSDGQAIVLVLVCGAESHPAVAALLDVVQVAEKSIRVHDATSSDGQRRAMQLDKGIGSPSGRRGTR